MIYKTKLSDKRNYGGLRKKTEYIVVHYTGNDGDTDEANATYFATGSRGASAHYFVDDDSVTLSVPIGNIAWSVGDGKKGPFGSVASNSNTVNIELCDTVKDGSYNLSAKTRANAIELICQLMAKYGLTTDQVIRHYDVSLKNCPAYFAGPNNKEWEKFKMEIDKAFGKYCAECIAAYQNELEADDWAKKELGEAITKKITDGSRPKAYATREEVAIMVKRN